MNAYSVVPLPLAVLAHRLRERAFLAKQRRRLARIAAYRRPWDDPAALVAAVRRKNLICTVTAGRSGTVYLERLLGLFPDTTSLHEPEPAFVSVLRLVQHEPVLARQFLLAYKLPFIAGVPTAHYAETSHLFCKGFLEPALELGIVPRIVLLRRSPRRVALSYLARRAVPGRTKEGLKYLLHPGDPGVLPLADWPRRSAYQLCFWYALEIERRQQAYAPLLARHGGTCVDVTPEELHEGERFLAVAAALGLVDGRSDLDAIRRRHRELSALIHNPNPRAPAVPDRIDAEERAVWEALGPQAALLRERLEARYAGRPVADSGPDGLPAHTPRTAAHGGSST